MEKFFNGLGIKKIAKPFAITALVIALILETAEFITYTIGSGFLFESFFAFAFDFAIVALIIYSFKDNNLLLLETAVVVLKTFEGTYYPLRSCQRLDVLVKMSTTDTFTIVNHIFFAVAAGLMLIALIFYCTFRVTGKNIYWNIMKICMLISSLSMIASSGLYIAAFLRNEAMEWGEIIEPVCLAIMFLGVYSTCEYIEGETNREKKANLA